MNRRYLQLSLSFLLLFVLAACPAPAPTTTSDTDSEAVAAEATTAPAEETAAEEEESTSGEEATYVVDTAASSIEWRGEKPLQYGHTGTVDIAEGEMTFAGDQLTGSSFIIDMTSIENSDLSGGDKADLEGHLKSDDFFGVETFPTAMLVIKSATPTDTDGQYDVVADLTMKDITNEITFVTNVTVGDGTLNAMAEIVIDRAQHDVRFDSGSFFDNLGDRLISDEIELTVSLVTNS